MQELCKLFKMRLVPFALELFATSKLVSLNVKKVSSITTFVKEIYQSTYEYKVVNSRISRFTSHSKTIKKMLSC